MYTDLNNNNIAEKSGMQIKSSLLCDTFAIAYLQ